MPETAMSHARIRQATVLDAGALARTHLQAWWETYGSLVPEEVYAQREQAGLGWWERVLAEPGGSSTWLAERDGMVVGLARVDAVGTGQVRPLELQLLYVLTAEQGRRSGTHLMELSIGDAPCSLWVPEANERAHDFFRQHGFEPDGARRAAAADWGGLAEVRMVR